MERRLDIFTNLSVEQQQAWAGYNVALGNLALSYQVDPDDLNELVGGQTERVILAMRNDEYDDAA